jgi:hypothetical protein
MSAEKAEADRRVALAEEQVRIHQRDAEVQARRARTAEGTAEALRHELQLARAGDRRLDHLIRKAAAFDVIFEAVRRHEARYRAQRRHQVHRHDALLYAVVHRFKSLTDSPKEDPDAED